MSSKDRSPSSNKKKVDTTFNYKNPLSQLAIYLSCMQGNFVLNCKYLALAALSLFKQKSADVVINELSERGLQLEDVYVVDNSLRFYRH